MEIAEFDAQVMRLFPSLPWSEPIGIGLRGQTKRLGCRLCIARLGLIGPEVVRTIETADCLGYGDLMSTRQEFLDH